VNRSTTRRRAWLTRVLFLAGREIVNERDVHQHRVSCTQRGGNVFHERFRAQKVKIQRHGKRRPIANQIGGAETFSRGTLSGRREAVRRRDFVWTSVRLGQIFPAHRSNGLHLWLLRAAG